jgi:PAS domain-containing protein
MTSQRTPTLGATIFAEEVDRMPSDPSTVPLSSGDGFLRSFIDAIPSFLFVVDADVVILDYNAAAGRLLNATSSEILKRRAGEALHCLHSSDSPQGCGRGPFCRGCVIRNSVNRAFAGSKTVRRGVKLELETPSGTTELHGLVTVTPFSHGGQRLALVVVEDVSQLVALREIIPICALCKKVRDDDEYWTEVESFFKKTWDVDFSHGYCPDCAAQELAKLTPVTS